MSEPGTTATPALPNARRALAGGLLVLACALGVGLFTATRDPALRPDTRPKLTDVMAQTIAARGIEAAVAQYRSLREQGFPGLRESTGDTNRLGYALLGKGEAESAIQVFRLNTETHPQSANAWDSLGEAYVAAGNTPLAVESYKKAVAIEPRTKTAAAALERLAHIERKPLPPLVLFHITAGMVGLISGAAAMVLRKGSRRHGLAGTTFAVAMLGMSATGAFMAFVDPHGSRLNVLMGLFTFYLVSTSWMTARRRKPAVGPFDWVAFALVSAVAAGLLNQGVRAVLRSSSFAGLIFTFGAVALLAALLDLRQIVRGGVSGPARLVRHLWRMCTALFIGVTSLFVGQPQLFSPAVRKSGLLPVPGLLVVALMLFWLVRVRLANRRPKAAAAKGGLMVGPAAT